jgi:hypothetical protein
MDDQKNASETATTKSSFMDKVKKIKWPVWVGIGVAALVVVLVAVFFAVSGGNTASKQVDVTVKSGAYVVPEDKPVTSSKQGYIALNLKLTNKTSNELDISTYSDITLKDSDGNTVKPTSFYASNDADMTMLSTTGGLQSDSSASGYIVFKVTKAKSYTLNVAGYDANYKKIDPVTKAIKLSDYKDTSSQPLQAVTAVVNTVYLGKTDSKDTSAVKKLVGNKNSDLTDSYKDAFSDLADSVFYGAQASDEQLKSMMTALSKRNAEVGKVTYKVKEVTPKYAEIQVTPEVVDLTDLSMDMMNYVDDLVDQNPDASYSDAKAAAYSEVVDKFEDVVKSYKTKKDSYGPTVKLTKENGKWVIDEKSLDDLSDDFTGKVY